MKCKDDQGEREREACNDTMRAVGAPLSSVITTGAFVVLATPLHPLLDSLILLLMMMQPLPHPHPRLPPLLWLSAWPPRRS